ncbi:hypothetical protein [Streptomyces albus]|uniref:hypothetical protein n=1 Tax=Streptomyces sp. PHES57 TaxID=2872626 RepID=UPI001CED22D9|nr:hypothetical protein [Streptomyces sp. PHES57]
MRKKFSNAAVVVAGVAVFAGLGTTAATAATTVSQVTASSATTQAANDNYDTYKVGTLEMCKQIGAAISGPGKEYAGYSCWLDENDEWWIDLKR